MWRRFIHPPCLIDSCIAAEASRSHSLRVVYRRAKPAQTPSAASPSQTLKPRRQWRERGCLDDTMFNIPVM